MKPLLVRPREPLSHLSPAPPWPLELLPTLSDGGEADSGDAGTLFEVCGSHSDAGLTVGAGGGLNDPGSAGAVQKCPGKLPLRERAEGRMRRTWHLASTTPPTEPGASPPSAPGSPPDIFKQLVDTWVERMERTNRQLEALVQRLEGGFPSYVPGDPDWERDHPEKDLW